MPPDVVWSVTFKRFVSALEARQKLAGGGAKRNHRYVMFRIFASRQGRRIPAWLVFSCLSHALARAQNNYVRFTGGYASLHHRLISLAPSAQRRFRSEIKALLRSDL